MTKKESAKLDSLAVGYALAIISAATMLLMGLGGNIGIYSNAAQQMMGWHMFFGLSPLGIIAGMIEAAVWGFVGGYVFALVYNKIAR